MPRAQPLLQCSLGAALWLPTASGDQCVLNNVSPLSVSVPEWVEGRERPPPFLIYSQHLFSVGAFILLTYKLLTKMLKFITITMFQSRTTHGTTEHRGSWRRASGT